MKQLIATALTNRSDLQGERLNIENLKTNALNTQNAVLPLLVALGSASSQGLAGQQKIVPVEGATGSGGPNVIPPGFLPCPPNLGGPTKVCAASDKYFIGGVGTALGQMIRRNFPSESVGAYYSGYFRNRQAQADYAIDQLSMRQSELQTAKDLSQVAVDVSNQSIGLQQAVARYQAAVKNRVLQEQLLDAEQKKFRLGSSTTYLVVQQQRDLATAQSAETAALVTYANARVALDQTLGTTLQVNHVSLDEAQSGHVARRSALPEKLPERP
jgi:outer membrane protein TolC